MSWLRKLDDLLLALLVVAVVDLVLFHGGVYRPWIQPKSYSGLVERQGERFGDLLETFPDRESIVVLGNSQTREGVREGQLEAELAASGQRFVVGNLGIGGSSPRAWSYLLQSDWIPLDTTRVVVLGINIRVIRAAMGDEQRDIDICKTRLCALEATNLAGTYLGLEKQLSVAAGVLFRSLLFRDDVKQYLSAPGTRHEQVAASRARFERRRQKGFRPDDRSDDNLLTARLGEDNRLVVDELAPFIREKPSLRRRIEELMVRRQRILLAMEDGEKMTRRFVAEPGKIRLLRLLVEDLNAKGVKVVFVMVPESPYSVNRPLYKDHFRTLFRRLKRRGADFAVWRDADTLRMLQDPAYFQDTLHLNAAGAELYTQGLAQFLAEKLAEPGRPAGKAS
ncbi:MAG: hypothetical protein AAF560_14535 [Acidobacteriota bacterium]